MYELVGYNRKGTERNPNMSENELITGKSLKQVAYEILKQKIVSCEILPGSTLTEDMLCEMLNASRRRDDADAADAAGGPVPGPDGLMVDEDGVIID